MQKEIDELYKLTSSDVKAVSKLLSRAFLNWSCAKALVPDEEKRKSNGYYAYKMSAKHIIKCGEAYAPSPKLEGVAMWAHSDYDKMSTWQMIKNGGLKILYKMGAKFVREMDICLEFNEKIHYDLIEEPHYHLLWLGVEPELQKTGIGTELMHAMLNKFSKENLKCYLDTQEVENVEYYKRFGFKVLRECQYPNIDVTYWGMLWEPEK